MPAFTQSLPLSPSHPMHSRPRFTEHFDLDLGNSTQGDIIPAPQAVYTSRMESPVSREAVYKASYRPMTIVAGETVIAGEPVTPPGDVVKHGKGKGRYGDHPPNPYLDEPWTSPLESVNTPYVGTRSADPKRKSLLDELSRFSFDSTRSSFDGDGAQSPTETVDTKILYPEDEEDEDDLDVTAELQADNHSGKYAEGESRCRVNSYEEVLLHSQALADEATAATVTSKPPIAGPCRAHIPIARETGTRPIRAVPSIKIEDIKMGNMTRDVSGTFLTHSIAKPRGCWQAFVHAIDGMSRAYEEEYFPKTDHPSQQWKDLGARVAPARVLNEVSKACAGADYRAENDDFSRKWRSACWKLSQFLDVVNEACVNAVVPKKYHPGDHEMV